MEYDVKKQMPLMEFLLQYEKKTTVKQYLNHQCILVNDKMVSQYNYPLLVGDKVTIQRKKSSNLDILYEDDEIIVINKPSGLLTIADEREKQKTAYHYVREYLKKKDKYTRIFIVHRLDRDTSGVLLFAKNEELKQLLQNNWNQIVKKRGYIALVEGKVKPEKATIQTYLSETKTRQVYVSKTGKLAISHYQVIKTYPNCTMIEVFLDTGRKNQIRVHMQSIHHPVLGDKKYGAKTNPLHRLALHSHVLSFKHPKTKQVMTFSSPIPKEFYRFDKKQP